MREWDEVTDPLDEHWPNELYECPKCGYRMLWKQVNGRGHQEYHNHYLDVIDKHGQCMLGLERERLKLGASQLMRNSSNVTVKKFAFLLRMYSHFMRSVQSYPDVDTHPQFEDYVAMLLKWPNLYCGSNKDIADLLRQDIGVKDGISDGSTYYGC